MTHINPDSTAVGGTQPEEMRVLHVYSQQYPHMDAEIIGNRAALKQLLDGLRDLLHRERADKVRMVSKSAGEFFAGDGEGYDLRLRLMPDDWKDPLWKDNGPHYCRFDDKDLDL